MTENELNELAGKRSPYDGLVIPPHKRPVGVVGNPRRPDPEATASDSWTKFSTGKKSQPTNAKADRTVKA